MKTTWDIKNLSQQNLSLSKWTKEFLSRRETTTGQEVQVEAEDKEDKKGLKFSTLTWNLSYLNICIQMIATLGREDLDIEAGTTKT